MASSWGFPARKSHASSPAARTFVSDSTNQENTGAPSSRSSPNRRDNRCSPTGLHPTVRRRGPAARSLRHHSTVAMVPRMATAEGSLGTILGVWAHPDDETYLSAGLMAQAVREGRRVVCVTATRGEEGSFDEERWPTATMGKVRENELMRSLEILGV